MSVPSSARRKGLSNIRTMSDSITETSEPQRKFLKLAVLSMEKVRRGKERETAQTRIGDIDRRAAEIDAERRELLRSALEGIDHERCKSDVRLGRGSTPQGRPGFNLKY